MVWVEPLSSPDDGERFSSTCPGPSPCDDFLSSVLATYNVRLPQLSPLAFPKLAVFAGYVPNVGSLHPYCCVLFGIAKTKDVEAAVGPEKLFCA